MSYTIPRSIYNRVKKKEGYNWFLKKGFRFHSTFYRKVFVKFKSLFLDLEPFGFSAVLNLLNVQVLDQGLQTFSHVCV